MTMSKSTLPTAHKKIVIKLGGSTLEGLNQAFFSNLKQLQDEGYKVIITHGGGPAINRELAKHNIETPIIDGIRVTNEEAIEIVQSTLIGKVNPKLVYELNAAGISAIGLNGFDMNLLLCDYLNKEVYQYVGKIKKINTNLLDMMIEQNLVPVIACVGVSEDGHSLNINGDTVASDVALAVGAESLILVTDVSGIKIENEFQTKAAPKDIEKWIQEGHIYGGMIPKVQGAIQCLKSGIPSVQIVDHTLTGTILSEE